MLLVVDLGTLLLLIIQVSHALNTTTVLQYANSTAPSSSSTSSITTGIGDLIAAGLGMQNSDSGSTGISSQKSSGTSSSSLSSSTLSSSVATGSSMLSSSPSNHVPKSSSNMTTSRVLMSSSPSSRVPMSSSNMTTSISRVLQSISNATASSPTFTSTGMGGNFTIAPSAASCLAELLSYSSVSQSWVQRTDNRVATTIPPGTSSLEVAYSTASQTAYITLCDHLPRGLGTPIVDEGISTSFYYVNTSSVLHVQGPNPAVNPNCTIAPSDCAILQSSWASRTSASPTVPWTASPSCTTTYSSNGLTCNPASCVIGAPLGQRGVRLLYWPVTRVGNLCNGSSTLTGTQTGQGPNTYANPALIGDLTITSPTVAILFAELTRTDGCGPTVRNHIVLMDPQSVTSQRGARAEEQFLPFDYADLNTKCVSSANVTGCYTDVPSAAYFGQPSCGAATFDNPICPQTIYNEYAPQIQLPEALSSVEPSWGTSCVVNELGGWDPPIALSTQSTLDVGPEPTTATATTQHDTSTAQPQSRPSSTPSKTGGDPKTTSAGESLLGQSTSISGADSQPSPVSQDPSPGPNSGSNVAIPSQPTIDPNTGSNPGSSPQTIGVVGGQSVAADPSNSNNVVIGGQTLQPSQQTTINNVPVSVGSGEIVVGGSSTIVPAASGQPAPTTIAVVGGASVIADPSATNAVVVAGQTLSDGQSTVINNTPVAVSGGNVVIGGGNGNVPASTIAIPTLAANGIGSGGNVGGSVVVVSSGHVIVGGSTLSVGQQTTIDGTVISAGSNQAEIGTSTIAFVTNPATSGSTTQIGGKTVAINSGHVVVGGSTLSAGQQTTIDGTVISAGSNQVAMGSSTIEFMPNPANPPYTTQIGGETIAISSGHVVVGGSTLSAGQRTTIDGTVISAGLTQAVIGSSTISILIITSSGPSYATNIDGEPISIISGHIVIGGLTLSAGQKMTIDGTVVSAGSSQAVIGSSTITMTPADSTSSGTGSTQTVTATQTVASMQTVSTTKTVTSAASSLNCLTYHLTLVLAIMSTVFGVL